MGFRQWLEVMGSVGAIVSCKDLKNPNFQIQGALSNLGCVKKEKTAKMRFGGKK
jgi:hypothetical protein